MYAAVSTMRRVLQPGHTPRPLHEYATRLSWPHFSQLAGANPCARLPHSKYFRSSRSPYTANGSNCRSEGATHKRVEVRSANRSPRHLYSSLAFSLISARAHYYADDAALIMQLDFT